MIQKWNQLNFKAAQWMQENKFENLISESSANNNDPALKIENIILNE